MRDSVRILAWELFATLDRVGARCDVTIDHIISALTGVLAHALATLPDEDHSAYFVSIHEALRLGIAEARRHEHVAHELRHPGEPLQ
jgi:hypothetical protein